jgi:hypothetical protein
MLELKAKVTLKANGRDAVIVAWIAGVVLLAIFAQSWTAALAMLVLTCGAGAMLTHAFSSPLSTPSG